MPAWPLGGLLTRVVAALAAVAVVAGAVAFWPRQHDVRLTAEFSRAVGLYPGSDVRVLGVRVGEVTSVTPRGEGVEVGLRYDARYRVPASAKAAVVAPSLVSDRYVQLYPAYRSGPVMRDGTRLGRDRTAVPVELDEVSRSLDDLLVALGPKGANKDGALSRALRTGAANLGGQGQAIHDANHELSEALATLSGGRDDLFGTVGNLQTLTSMLATNDTQVRRLNADLATVSTQLAGERDDLAATLKNLAVALDEVSSFVHDNRTVLKTDIDHLASVTTTVAKQRAALAETLDNAPVALSNLQNAYNPKTGTLDTRANLEQFDDPALLLCSLVTGPTGTGDSGLCQSLQEVLGPVTDLLARLQSGPGTGAADPTLGGLLPGGPR